MAMAAVHERVLAEDVSDRAPDRLGAVDDDDEQDRLIRIQAAVDERSASSVRASVAFSVLPSQSPSGILTPSVVIPSATTRVRSGISRPSSIITASRTSSSRRDISSESAVRARSMNISDTDVFEVDEDDCSTSLSRLTDPRELAGRDAGEHPVHRRLAGDAAARWPETGWRSAAAAALIQPGG